MFQGSEADRLALRELIDTYSDAVMRGDGDAWIDTWAPDGEWCFRDRTVAGRDDIRRTWEGAMSGFAGVMFLCQPGSAQVEGDRATMTTYTFEHLEMADGSTKFQAGLYHDTAIRRDKWRFLRREFSARELRI